MRQKIAILYLFIMSSMMVTAQVTSLADKVSVAGLYPLENSVSFWKRGSG